PRHGRDGPPPPDVIPIGRSVIVPANGSLPNIILSPRSVFRVWAALERERFDVLHLHEPMTPTPCVAAMARYTGPMVGTFHASGGLGWLRISTHTWGFLADRLDPGSRSPRARPPPRSSGFPASTTSSPTASSSRPPPTPAAASTASSSPAGTSRGRDCTSS